MKHPEPEPGEHLHLRAERDDLPQHRDPNFAAVVVADERRKQIRAAREALAVLLATPRLVKR